MNASHANGWAYRRVGQLATYRDNWIGMARDSTAAECADIKRLRVGYARSWNRELVRLLRDLTEAMPKGDAT